MGLLLVLSLGRMGEAAEGRLVFASTPWKAPEVLEEVHRPLMQYLARVLAVETVFHVATDYEELGRRLEVGTVDVGLFSPNAYVQAKSRLPGLQYLASIQKLNVFGQVQDHYQGFIVVKADSPYQGLQDLQGTRFGFTDPQSVSGYLYPKLLFRERGIHLETFFSRTFMLRKHDKVLRSILEGAIDAGACYDDAYYDLDRQRPGTLRVLARTPPIPFDAYAAGGHVSQGMVQALRQALVGYLDAPERRPEMLGSPHSFVVRDDTFYDSVRAIVHELQ